MPTNKHQVITCHKLHPRWSSVQIAEHLGCCDAYVRATFKRNGLRLPRRIIRAEVIDLGLACVAVGLSVADIHKFNRGEVHG